MSAKRVKPGGTLIACSTHAPAEESRPSTSCTTPDAQHVHPRHRGTSSPPTGRAPVGPRVPGVRGGGEGRPRLGVPVPAGLASCDADLI